MQVKYILWIVHVYCAFDVLDWPLTAGTAQEIPPISTFTSFGRHAGLLATSQIKGIHTSEEQQLGYNVCEGPFISPWTNSVCVCVCAR